MTDPANQYPVDPQGQEALRFMDLSVRPEATFEHQTIVEYDDQTTLRFDEPGDGFLIGFGSIHKYAGGFSTYCIDTDQARYYGDGEIFARQEYGNEGAGKKKVQPFEATVLGDGISGRIGQDIMLPGAKDSEVVKAVELQYKVGLAGDVRGEGDSPFSVGEQLLGYANHQLEMARMIGHVAENAE